MVSSNLQQLWCVKCDKKQHISLEDSLNFNINQKKNNEIAETSEENETTTPIEFSQNFIKKNQEKRDSSEKIGNYLLSGWAMLAEHCES